MSDLQHKASPVDRRSIIAVSVIVGLALAAIAVTAVVTVGGGDAVSASPTPTSAAPATSIAAAPTPELGGMLLESNELSDVLGAPIALTYSQPSMWSTSAGKHVYAPPECDALMGAAQAIRFTSLDWLGAWVKSAQGTPDSAPPYVVQAVVLAPDAGAATKYVNDTAAIWKRCVGKTYSTPDPVDGVWDRVEVTTPASGRLESIATEQSDSPWTCRHHLTAKAAYLVDAMVCGPDTTKTAALVDRILGKIPG